MNKRNRENSFFTKMLFIVVIIIISSAASSTENKEMDCLVLSVAPLPAFFLLAAELAAWHETPFLWNAHVLAALTTAGCLRWLWLLLNLQIKLKMKKQSNFFLEYFQYRNSWHRFSSYTQFFVWIFNSL